MSGRGDDAFWRDEKVKAEHEVLTGPVWLRPGGQHEPDGRAAQAHASLGVFFKGHGRRYHGTKKTDHYF